MAILTVRDETTRGREVSSLAFEVPSTITLRELIRLRVREEVARHKAERRAVSPGLVEPSDAQPTLAGYRLRARRGLDWEAQADIALAGFSANAFFVLVGDRQVTDLDETLSSQDAWSVTFVRLVPLVGG